MRQFLAFPAWLKQARLEHGLTQTQLAALAGISLSLLRKYETGVRVPPRTTALRLAAALQLAPSDAEAFVAAARLAHLPTPTRSAPEPVPRLPHAPTPLLGREADLDHVCALLRDPTSRLVTLLGPPGVGKSRLALATATALAPAFADGSAFVELAPLSDEAALVPLLASALGLPGISNEAALLALAATRIILLVLDNCEHLPAVAPLVARLLSAAPQLTLLATSRTPLRLRAEQRVWLAPLALPGSERMAAVAQAPATRLFCARAAAINPNFALNTANAPVIAAICHRLDGLPLAIELAAAHCDQRDPAALLAELAASLAHSEQQFVDLPPHQRTLQATIAWSEQLLAPTDQAAFARLGVFVGSFDVAAAQAVGVNSPQLVILNEAGLIQRLADGCFRLLETLRAYAGERLARHPEVAQIHADHATHYAQFAETLAPLLGGAAVQTAMVRLDTELPNLRAALHWSLAHDEGIIAARITVALRVYWLSRGAVYEGRLVEPLLRVPNGVAMPPALRARALLTTGYLASQQGAMDSYQQIEQGLDLARQYGTPTDITLGLILAGMLARYPGNQSIWRAILDEAVTLARTIDHPWLLAYALNQLGFSYVCDGFYREGLPALDEAVRLTAAAGEQVMHYRYRCDLGEGLRAMGDLVQARQILEQLLTELGAAGDLTATWEAQLRLGIIALETGELGVATTQFDQAERLVSQLGIGYGRAYLLRWRGQLALAQGELAAAAEWLNEARRWAVDLHGPDQLAAVLTMQAWLALEADEQLRAARLLGASNGLVTCFRLRADRMIDPMRQNVQTALTPAAQTLADHVNHRVIERIPRVSYPNAQIARDSIRLDRVLAAVLRLQ